MHDLGVGGGPSPPPAFEQLAMCRSCSGSADARWAASNCLSSRLVGGEASDVEETEVGTSAPVRLDEVM